MFFFRLLELQHLKKEVQTVPNINFIHDLCFKWEKKIMIQFVIMYKYNIIQFISQDTICKPIIYNNFKFIKYIIL